MTYSAPNSSNLYSTTFPPSAASFSLAGKKQQHPPLPLLLFPLPAPLLLPLSFLLPLPPPPIKIKVPTF